MLLPLILRNNIQFLPEEVWKAEEATHPGHIKAHHQEAIRPVQDREVQIHPDHRDHPPEDLQDLHPRVVLHQAGDN